MVQFYVDDPTNVFFVRTASDVPSGQPWEFNHPFFLLLNLAVGGTGSWPGPPDNTTPNPAVMKVDYVRWYTPSAIAGPTMTAPAISVAAGATGTTSLSLTSTVGAGRVYLSCSTNAPGATCAVNSSDPLNQYTVNFSTSATATATVSVTAAANKTALATLAGSPGKLGMAFNLACLIAIVLMRFSRGARCRVIMGTRSIFTFGRNHPAHELHSHGERLHGQQLHRSCRLNPGHPAHSELSKGHPKAWPIPRYNPSKPEPKSSCQIGAVLRG